MSTNYMKDTRTLFEKILGADNVIKLIVYIAGGAYAFATLSNKIENHDVVLKELQLSTKEVSKTLTDIKVDIGAIKQSQKDQQDVRNNRSN